MRSMRRRRNTSTHCPVLLDERKRLERSRCRTRAKKSLSHGGGKAALKGRLPMPTGCGTSATSIVVRSRRHRSLAIRKALAADEGKEAARLRCRLPSSASPAKRARSASWSALNADLTSLNASNDLVNKGAEALGGSGRRRAARHRAGGRPGRYSKAQQSRSPSTSPRSADETRPPRERQAGPRLRIFSGKCNPPRRTGI